MRDKVKCKCFNCFARYDGYLFRPCPKCNEFGLVWKDDLENNITNCIYEVYSQSNKTFSYSKMIKGLIFDLLAEYPKERNRLLLILKNDFLNIFNDVIYDQRDFQIKTGSIKKHLKDEWGLEGPDIEYSLNSAYVCGGLSSETKREYKGIYCSLNKIFDKQAFLIDRFFSQAERESLIYDIVDAFPLLMLCDNNSFYNIKNCLLSELENYRIIDNNTPETTYGTVINIIQYCLIEIEMLIYLNDYNYAYKVAEECISYSDTLINLLHTEIREEVDDEAEFMEYSSSVESIKKACDINLKSLKIFKSNKSDFVCELYLLLNLDTSITMDLNDISFKIFNLKVDLNGTMKIVNNNMIIKETTQRDSIQINRIMIPPNERIKNIIYEIEHDERRLHFDRLNICSLLKNFSVSVCNFENELDSFLKQVDNKKIDEEYQKYSSIREQNNRCKLLVDEEIIKGYRWYEKCLQRINEGKTLI